MNPIDNTGQIAAERDLIAMWRDERVQQARQHVAAMWRNAWEDAVPAEMERSFGDFVDEYMTNWMLKAAASDAHHPRFVRNFMPTYSWHGHQVPGARTGGDNPDNTYRLAGIEHGGSYRVTCVPLDREPAHVSFNLVANFGTSVIVQSTESQLVEREADGSFILTIDDKPAAGRVNHLTTAPNVKFLFVRDSMEDWTRETPLQLTIERLEDSRRAPLSCDHMTEQALFRMREDVSLYFWFQSGLANMRPNRVMRPAIGRGMGGMLTQGISKGHFRLDPDEAVIIDYDPAGARYAAIELTDWFYRSIDAHRIQSSLTRSQSHVDADGRIRAVVCRHDPGVANWVDTGGLADVLFYLRWQGLPSGPPRELDIRMTTVRLTDLHGELPANTVWYDPDERDGQIRERQEAFARRIKETSADPQKSPM